MKIQNRVPFDWTIRSARCFPRMLFVCLKCSNKDPLFLFPFPLYYSFFDCVKYLASDRAIAKLKEKQQTTLQPLVLNGRNQTDSGGVRPEADSGGGRGWDSPWGPRHPLEAPLHLVPGPLSTHLMSISEDLCA